MQMTDGQQETGPARRIPTDPPGDAPEPTVALCLSGGGYRAMLFHLGALLRLNETAWLARIDRFSSVSGGSITAGALALAWNRLKFEDGIAANLDELVVAPVRGLAGHTVDVGAVIRGAIAPGTIAERAASAYREHLFADVTLQDLPESPRFVFNATSLQSGVLWRFSKPYMADWRVGRIERPAVALADAVAASAAFPPVLSPFTLELGDAEWTSEAGNHLTDGVYRRRAVLSDGGVYDNLGLEAAWKRCRTVLVSDGGGRMAFEDDPATDWPRQMLRVLKVIDNQVRDLRKRQCVEAYIRGDREGAYWGIRSEIADYALADSLPCPPEQTTALAETPTRLERLESEVQERLINWGYAICDAALRAHVDRSPAAPARFPYPEAAVG